MPLERVGVQAVVDGYNLYRQQAAGVNQATDSMAATSRRAAGATAGLSTGLGGFLRTAGAVALGTSALTIANQALGASFSGTVGAAIAFESSFAGILKTVDATEQQFADLERTNRDLAKSIPLSVNEINRIGELGGQLGVAVEDLGVFERTIADLANTTDLTVESASTAFAQFANIMELPIAQIDRVGAAIVDLGNNSATTESQILEFSLRIAGAGKIAGLTAAEVSGIGAAFASVGVQAEAGGTSIQKVLITITEAAAKGGKELDVLAETAGLTATEFRELARQNPAEAFLRFVEGLAAAGDRAFSILDQLQIGDQRVIRSFLSVANAGDLLRRSIELSSDAFLENTALTEEAEKRYNTTASRLKILRNNINDVGISAGQILLPALVQASDAAVRFLNALRPVGPALGALAQQIPQIAVALASVAAAMAAIRFATFVSGAVAATTSASQLALLFPNLTVQMLGLRGAVLATTAALGAGNLAGALAGLRLALTTPAGAAIALTAALIGLDQVSRRLDDQSLLQQFSLSDERAEGAAKATDTFADSVTRLNRALAQGAAPQQAFAKASDDVLTRVRELNQEIASLQAKSERGFATGGVGGLEQFGRNVAGSLTLGLVDTGSQADLKESLASLREEQEKLIALAPDLVKSATDPEAAYRELAAAIDSALSTGAFEGDAARGLVEAREAARGAVVEFQNLQQSGTSAEETLIRLTVAGDNLVTVLQQMAATDPEAALAFLAGDRVTFLQKMAGGIDVAKESFDALADAATTVDEAMELAFDQLDFIDPVTESLKLQKLALEEEKRALEAVGASTDGVEARLNGVNAALEAQAAAGEKAQGIIRLFIATARQADVDLATIQASLEGLARRLNELPEEERIAVITDLDEFAANQVLAFIALLKNEAITIPVAFNIARNATREGILSGALGSQGQLALANAGVNPGQLLQVEQIARDTERAVDGLASSYTGSSGAAAQAEQHIDRLTRVLQAAADGTISLSEALELGITAQEAATLELEIARQREADEAFRLEVALAALAQRFPGMSAESIKLALALQQIAAHLKETGQSVQDFIRETATKAVESLRSQLDSLFATPTRESLQLQLRLAELERRRLQRVGGGATPESLKALDKEIEQVRNLIALREQDARIEKLKIELSDKTLQTDREKREAAVDLKREFERATDQVADLNGQLFNETLAHIFLTNQALKAADALSAIAAFAPSGAASGAFGNYGAGTPMILHGEEAVVPLRGGTIAFPPAVRAAVIAQMGGGAAPAFAPSLTITGAPPEALRRQFHTWVDEWFAASRARAQNAGYTPGSGVGF